MKPETSVYTLDGKLIGKVDSDGVGSISSVEGSTDGHYGFFSFQSFFQPPTLYRLDTVTAKREVFAQPKTSFDSSQYELKQVFMHLEGRHAASPSLSPARRD